MNIKRFTTILMLVLIVLLALMLPGAAAQAQEAEATAEVEVITFDPDTGQFEIPVVVNDAGWFETLVLNPWAFAFVIFGIFVLVYGYQNNKLIKSAMDHLYASVPEPFKDTVKGGTLAGTSVLMAGLGGATKVIPGELDDQVYDLIKRTTLETLKELFADETIQYRFPTAPKPFAVPPNDPGLEG